LVQDTPTAPLIWRRESRRRLRVQAKSHEWESNVVEPIYRNIPLHEEMERPEKRSDISGGEKHCVVEYISIHCLRLLCPAYELLGADTFYYS